MQLFPAGVSNLIIRYSGLLNYGNIEVTIENLTFFVEYFKLTKEDLMTDNCWILAKASGNGLINEMLYLKLLGFGKIEARIKNNYAARLAAENGHVGALQELKLWGLDKKDILSEDNYAFKMAAENGHVGVLRALRELWNMRKEDVVSESAECLIYAYQNNHTTVIGELRNWGITKEYILSTALRESHNMYVRYSNYFNE